MAQVVGQLMIEMAANVARLQTDMAKATKTVDGAMAQIQKSVEVAKKALGGLVGIEVINRMAQATKAAIDMADGLGELAEKTGMSVKELSGLRVAFQLNGLQADQVAGAMKKLSVSVAKGADAFASMGINTKNVDGTLKNTRQILGEVADRFASYRDGANKTALAVNLFGKAGGDMVLLLNQGAAGLARFDEEARKLGIALDDDASAAAGRFNDEMDKLGFVIDAAWLRFSSQLLPVLTDVVTYFRNGEQQTTLFTGALNGLAAAIKAVYSIFVGFGFVLESTGKFLGNFVATFATLATDGIDAARRVKEEFKGEFAKDLENAANAINNAWSEVPQTIKSTGDAANDAAKKNAPAIKTLSKEIDAQGKAAKSAAKSMGVYSDAHIKAYEAYKKGSKSAEDLIDNIKRETAALKMSSEARAVANELRELEKTGLDTTSAAYKKYAAEVIKATTGREAVRKQIEEQEAARQRWTDLWADVGRSLTDSLMEGGKNAKEYLEGTFRAMILRPAIEGVISPITDAIAKQVAAAFTSAAVGSAGGSATGGILGTLGIAGAGAAAGGGGAAGGMAAYAGPVAIAIAAALVGKELGGRIAKDYRMFDGAMGELVEWSGVVGGVLNRAFGRTPYKLRSEMLQGQLTTGGADLEIIRRLKSEGGTFRSDKTRTIIRALEGEALAVMNTAIADMTKASKAFAETMGISSDSLADFVYNVDLNFKGLKPEERQERLAQLMQEFNDAIVKQLIPDIAFMAKEGETAAQTMERLSNNLQAANAVMDLINQTMYDTSVMGAQLSTVLIDAFGGIESFTQATSIFYDQFFTDTEKFTNTTDMLAREFAKLGLSVPATREEYRRLVEAQNRFTVEGAATYAQLVKLSGAFASVTSEIGAAATELSKTIATLVTDATRAAVNGIQEQINATRNLAEESRDMARAYMDAATAIRATAQGLMFGRAGAPQSVLRQQYQSTLQMALGGDLASLQGIGGAASSLVESVRSTATSRVDFIRQAAVIQAQLEEAAKVADATAQAEITLAQLYDVNVDMMELTLQSIEEGTATNALLEENIAAINTVNASIKEQGGAAGNVAVTTLLSQILAATKKQTEADATAAAEAARQEALRQAEIIRQQALAAEAARKQQEAQAAAAAAAEKKRQDDIAAINARAAEIGKLIRATGGLTGSFERSLLNKELEVLREQVKALGGTPAFADGGMHSGGLRLVGENGPELEATGPARIYNARQTAGILAGGADMVAELRLLRQEVGELRYEARATATNTNKTQRLLERVTLDGEAMQTVAYS